MKCPKCGSDMTWRKHSETTILWECTRCPYDKEAYPMGGDLIDCSKYSRRGVTKSTEEYVKKDALEQLRREVKELRERVDAMFRVDACPVCGKTNWVEEWTAMLPPKLTNRRCVWCDYEEKF